MRWHWAIIGLSLTGCVQKGWKKPIVTLHPKPQPLNHHFSVLSYNVKGLPTWFANTESSKRIAMISPLLNSFDFSFVQENFWYDDELNKEIVTPFQTKPPRASGLLKWVGSGLRAFAKHPFKQRFNQGWQNCNGYFTSKNDCMSEKGFQLISVPTGPKEAPQSIDIYNLHMDAGDSLDDQNARAKQTIQLLKSIAIHSKDKAVIVIGDFNMKPESPSMSIDQQSMKKLLEEGGLSDACLTLNCPSPNELDRVLYKSVDNLRLKPTLWKKAKHFVDGDGNQLSDHPPIAVEFELILKGRNRSGSR